MKVNVIGFGSRGRVFSEIFTKLGAQLTAVCDIRRERLELARELFGLPDGMLFSDESDFFALGKTADLCVAATPDALHTRHALAALKCGYDLLLEKPIACSEEDCRIIYKTAEELGRRVFVCLEMRYTPFFTAIKNELDTGKYGKIATINLTENVIYWHQAHSFVRGNWRDTETSSPMIVAKCCHDLDMISWLTGRGCMGVSSMGSLSFYKRENAPAESGERCLDCRVKAGCAYDAERFYIEDRLKKGNTGWPVDVVATDPAEKTVYEALRTGPYGRCVFKCDNNAVDHQVVNMFFEDGVTAHLTMTAFSKDGGREIHIHCEKGEIFGREPRLTCHIFGGKTKKIDASKYGNDQYGHGGGDFYLAQDIVSFYNGEKSKTLTDIKNSMQGHFIGFAAEKSRLKNGALIVPDCGDKS